MTTPVQDTNAMIAGMTPILHPATYHYLSTTSPDLIQRLLPFAICAIREDEGLTLIIDSSAAAVIGDNKIDTTNSMRRILLTVYSSLQGFGLTAAVAGALSEAKIACNMVAGFHHDHVFVPARDAERALEILLELQRKAKE